MIERTWLGQMATAVSANDLTGVDALLNAQVIDPSMGDVNVPVPGEEAPVLFIAVDEQRTTIVQRLLEHPTIDPNTCNQFGVSPLMHAIGAYPFPGAAPVTATEVVRTLVLGGSDPEALGWPKNSEYAVNAWQAVAMVGGAFAAVLFQTMQEACGRRMDVDQRDQQGNTLLHLALQPTSLKRMSPPKKFGDNDVPARAASPAVLWLLSHGASLSTCNDRGRTPLEIMGDNAYREDMQTFRILEREALNKEANKVVNVTQVRPRARL